MFRWQAGSDGTRRYYMQCEGAVSRWSIERRRDTSFVSIAWHPTLKAWVVDCIGSFPVPVATELARIMQQGIDDSTRVRFPTAAAAAAAILLTGVTWVN